MVHIIVIESFIESNVDSLLIQKVIGPGSVSTVLCKVVLQHSLLLCSCFVHLLSQLRANLWQPWVSLLLHSEGLSSTEFTSSSSTFLLLCSRVSGSGILSIVSSLKSFASMPYFSSLRDRVYNKWILTRFFNDCLRNYFPERSKCSDINELRNICGENHQKKLHKTSCQTSSEGTRPGFESSCVSPTLHIGPGRTEKL